MTHPDLNSAKLPLAQYQQEILECDRIIRTLPGYPTWFRYPFLREGNTPEKRDGMRAFLKQHGYRNAYVSLDTSDWRLNDELVRVLRADAGADVAPIRAAYLSHLKQRALAYRALSQQLQGRDIKHHAAGARGERPPDRGDRAQATAQLDGHVQLGGDALHVVQVGRLDRKSVV